MRAGICLNPVMRRNCFRATKSPDRTQRSRWSPPCQRFMFRQTTSTIENADSITLVLASVFAVNRNVKPMHGQGLLQPKLRAALGLRSINLR